MAYIGQNPFQEFSSIPTKDSFTGDGSATAFDLANDVVRGAENALEVFVNNVRQEPGSGKAFTLGVDGSNNYRRITFTAAPANGASIYVINDKTNLSTIAPLNTDFNGVEIVLDADADTTLHAETDDQIDLRIAGVDVAKFLQSSGDLVIKPMVDARDIIFQQFDGNKVFEINDGNFVGVGGNSTQAGEIRIFEDSDNGTNYSGFKAAASTTGSVAYTLPAADGSSGEQLTTNGSGVLSWATGGVSLANDANNRVVTGTGSGLNGEANLTFDGSALQLTGTLTVGVDDTGYDVKLFGATSGKSLLWDESADSLIVTGTTTLVGTTNLDAVDIDGAVQLDSTLTVGVNDTGYDVKFFGATAGKSLLWDESADTLIVTGNATISGTATTTGVHTFTAIPLLPDNTVELADIQADAIDGTKIADDAINSEHYTDGSIDTAHIAADQIVASLIADNAINSEHYTDGSIDTAHIADLNVTTGKIAADAITGAKIADDAINSEHYTNGSIDTAHIAADQIVASLIADNAIDSEHYTDGSIDTAHIGADQITNAKIADDQIDSEHYVDGSIDTAHIADNQITLAKMAGGTDGNIISFDASGDPVAIATGSDGQVLTSTGAGSPPAFEAAAAGGKLLQIQHVLITGTVTSITSSDFTATEVLDIITPTAADSKILVMMNLSPGTYEDNGLTNQFGAGIYRDINGGGFSRIYAGQGNVYGGYSIAAALEGEYTSNFPTTLIFVDSTHNSTNAITYKLYISQRGGNSTNTGSSAMERSVTLMEIGA